MLAISSFVVNPEKISQRTFEASKLNPNYCQALRQMHIKLVDRILYYHESIVGSVSYACLQLVPAAFWNIVFISCHSNPLGGHLNAVRTFHRIRLRYYWPNMYSYLSHMCHSCPGCMLTNPTRAKSSKLIYNFPIKAPFLVLHIDSYQVGKKLGFEVSSHYLIACCRLCTFAVMEPVANANATMYASAIMKIILCLGCCPTCVLNKDSKFYGSATRHSTSSGSIAISLAVATTIPCWSRGLIGILTRDSELWLMSVTPIALLWKWFFFWFMRDPEVRLAAELALRCRRL